MVKIIEKTETSEIGMAHSWYYVENNDRVGPIEEQELCELVHNKTLVPESYIWRKGFDNWVKLEEVEELKELLSSERKPQFDTLPENVEEVETEDNQIEEAQEFDWQELSSEAKVITVKTGGDRDGAESEYGPFSLEMIRKLYNEKRINGKTLVFTPGMDQWEHLAEISIFEQLLSELPPVLDETERRVDGRKPFVARLLFHDSSDIYEGVCRDISVGGLQVLVADAPVEVGGEISLNVHPDNTDYCFVAKGEIVRLLEGNQGFSLRFLDLNEEAKGAISTYIHQ